METSRERLDLPNGELSLPRQHEAHTSGLE
jgi:hypothetical protein